MNQSRLRYHLVDATRISDGRLVYIKRVQTGDLESAIARMLVAERVRWDPRNHSVPVLDYFRDDDGSSISYLVMPFLSPMDSPKFETAGEVVDFVDQVLEVGTDIIPLGRIWSSVAHALLAHSKGFALDARTRCCS